MNNRGITKVLFLFALLLASCSTKHKAEEIWYQCPMKCEGEKTYFEQTRCPVCKMELKSIQDLPVRREEASDEIQETSIFNLSSTWKTQNDKLIKFIDLKGRILVVTMIYTSCKSACPRLMADVKNIHDAVKDKSVRYVLVSIDPKTDTPQQLKKVAIENEMDDEQWVFLQGTEESVREFANVLAVKYAKISPIDFSHSNIISLFDTEGTLQYQQEGLGVDNKELVAKINEWVE